MIVSKFHGEIFSIRQSTGWFESRVGGGAGNVACVSPTKGLNRDAIDFLEGIRKLRAARPSVLMVDPIAPVTFR
jgi:hypothetical protein